MRIIFMGTPDFAVPSLQACIDENGIEVAAVVTQPDKPKGRGNKMQMCPVKEKALEYNIPVYQPKRARDEDFIKGIEKLAPDVIVVIAFGQILPKTILDIPRLGCINVHASLLPKYRGAAPIQWSVINGEKETGVTTMYMDEGLDTGDMILKTAVPIGSDDTGASMFNKLAAEGAALLIDTLALVEQGTAPRELQDAGQASYVKMLTKDIGNIDWNRSAEEIERFIRGLNSWPSAYTYLEGKALKLWRGQVIQENESEWVGEPGQVVSSDKALYIMTGDGILKVTELQLEGKKKMSAADFLRGHSVQVGTSLPSGQNSSKIQ